ncbi:hypothetical protein BX616_010641 [Lobosporangium transversale]|uniref:PRMT5 arginine-N-methyltransferase-domain-containing protein n=1 Tax=Lobosporangium transversale TaxID=64571 RepID=A0A1Y2GA10_9FUNG|nr:PRMT5 arginine-N-methyltransferase-domain-containing protein [Lobosporangium transversale]KAF9918000.1 hypothetical protein BX616_010641 [Lobosporangium transversale]ORY96993.1 PRMT5 arginine-N-methyltransferase-domain-containing protein [Lobosporangium transversale]|eukprot:XP_021875555.1 PRMT5 arginine-N-methyltransferase-domain-containing protein [Lobosporangium transversale]
MAISFQQIAAMSLESVQIGYLPPADKITAENLHLLVAYAQSKGFDYVVSPINSPSYQRVLFEGHGPQSPDLTMWRAGMEALKPVDLVVRTADHSDLIVGTLSEWQDFDSKDPKIRLHSELALRQQFNWASHLGLGGILLPYPPSTKPLTNYGRVVTGSLSMVPYTACWLKIPCMDEQLEIGVPEELQGMKSWERWNIIHNMVGSESKLGVALELSGSLPTDQVLDRWFAEPVKVIILPEDTFLTNGKGYPVLSKRHQHVVRKFMKFKPYFIIASSKMAELTLDDTSVSPHADYIRYMHRSQDAPSVIDQFATGYQDYLQAPLQPLQDNLESSTYETFEKDPVKYQQYELAIERALRDRPVAVNDEEDVTIVMVVGAGRGPLVDCSLRAANRAGKNIRVYAVEKNPNAFVTIQNKKATLWGDRVNIVFSDMRTWSPPEQAHILVSELLGSFGDNELSPECLDGAQKVLRPDGISIPADYTTFIAPMSSSKLHADVSAFKDLSHFETSYVVMFKAVSLLAQPKPIWSFEHPNKMDIPMNQNPLSNHHNIRSGSIEFTCQVSGMVHGVAGYFESVLYKDVMLSINPATHSPGMFSWFPIYFPIKTPIYVPAGSQVVLDFWRLTDTRKVWYEWRAEQMPAGSTHLNPTTLTVDLLSHITEAQMENVKDQRLSKPFFLERRTTNPMELHEIRVNVACFLSRRELRNCILVCEAWWESFMPFLWIDLRPVYHNVLGSPNDYPSPMLMRKNGHLIKTFEYNGHGTVLLSMIPHSDGPYKSEELEWRKSQQEEDNEANWLYADEDLDSETSIDPEETLSDFEERIEKNKITRQNRMLQLQEVKLTNKRQNETSRFLNDNTDYRHNICNQIEKLIFTEKRFSRDQGCHYRNWIKLMQLNQDHLRSLEFNFAIRSIEAFRDIFHQITLLKQLSELTLVDNDLDIPKTKTFLEMICVRLRKLELKNVRIYHGPPHGYLTQSPLNIPITRMERMKSLAFIKVQSRNTDFTTLFLRQCPNLVELVFHLQWPQTSQQFAAILSERLINVTHLTFKASGVSDLGASEIIKSLPILQKLDLSESAFGLVATNHLSIKHHFTISCLDIRGCSHVTGSMIQRILGECRSLQSFCADHIHARDIVNNSVYPTWACIGLKELSLDFQGNPNDIEANLKIYRQLAQLVCLKHLNISRSDRMNNTNGYSNCLTLGLRAGLKELRTMVHMQSLTYRGLVNNEVGVVELQWMAKAWPQLSQISGKLIERKSTKFNVNILPKLTAFSSGVHSLNARNNDHSSVDERSMATHSSQIQQTITSTNRSFSQSLDHRTRNQAPPNLLVIELRRLKLNHRIQVIHHVEDTITPEQRRRQKYLLGGSSEDESERPLFGHIDPRYR